MKTLNGIPKAEVLLAAVRLHGKACKALQKADAKHYGKSAHERTRDSWRAFQEAERNEHNACRGVLEAAQQWAAHYE